MSCPHEGLPKTAVSALESETEGLLHEITGGGAR